MLIKYYVKRSAIMLVAALSLSSFAENSDELDTLLIATLNSENYSAFLSALEAGANPNRVFGSDPDEWAMCFSTQTGSEKYLQTLIDFGGQVNLYNPNNPSKITSMPIACSIHFRNENAFEILVQTGVDVNANLCVGCSSGKVSSPLLISLIAAEYSTTLRLIGLSDVSKKDIDAMILAMENWPMIETYHQYPARLKLIQYLKDSGYNIDPWVPGKVRKRK